MYPRRGAGGGHDGVQQRASRTAGRRRHMGEGRHERRVQQPRSRSRSSRPPAHRYDGIGTWPGSRQAGAGSHAGAVQVETLTAELRERSRSRASSGRRRATSATSTSTRSPVATSEVRPATIGRPRRSTPAGRSLRACSTRAAAWSLAGERARAPPAPDNATGRRRSGGRGRPRCTPSGTDRGRVRPAEERLDLHLGADHPVVAFLPSANGMS